MKVHPPSIIMSAAITSLLLLTTLLAPPASTSVEAFQWAPLKTSLFGRFQHRHHGEPQPQLVTTASATAGNTRQSTTALPARRGNDDFSNDGSSRKFLAGRGGGRGFGSSNNNSSSGGGKDKNGKERVIQSVKDVDADLNEEILGALRSAEEDLSQNEEADLESSSSVEVSAEIDDSTENEGGEVDIVSQEDVEVNEEATIVATTKLPKEETNSDTLSDDGSSWDDIKESVYNTADNLKASLTTTSQPNYATDFMPTPPNETPGEKAMKQFESIDVTSASYDTDASQDVSGGDGGATDEDIMGDEEAMLLEAQREAEEAEAMLKLAEEEAARLELELAQMEQYNIDADYDAATTTTSSMLDILEDEIEVEEPLPEDLMDGDDEEDALTSMASAYQAALDAANDNVNLLSSQIEALELELATTISQMESSVEDKERIGAEYLYLAENYGRYRDGTANSITLLEEEIGGYESKIESLQMKLNGVEEQLVQAVAEADKWKADYEKIQEEMAEQVNTFLQQRQTLESRLNEVTSSIEADLAASKQEYETTISSLKNEHSTTLSQSKKMVSALRQSLRNTRSEKKSLQQLSEKERVRAVDDVRTKMNEEVANLRSILKGLEGDLGEKERVVEEAIRGEEEKQALEEEVRYVVWCSCWM